MTWKVSIKYEESPLVENQEFTLETEAVHKMAELLKFEAAAAGLFKSYDVIKHIKSINIVATSASGTGTEYIQ